jgi:hypothetical protein
MPIFILIGSAARASVERENAKMAAKIRLRQLKRNAILFITYLLLLGLKTNLENTPGLS